MKLAITIAIAVAVVSQIGAMNTNQRFVCTNFNVAETYLRKLESNGISITKIPWDKIVKVKKAIQSGLEAGCDKKENISKQRNCKRFFQRGKSVVCQ